MGIETVVLDLDDTLVATARSYRRALSVLGRYGVDAGDFVTAHQRWWAVYQEGRCTMQDLYHGRMSDCGLTGDVAMEANERFIEASAAPRWRRGARRMLLTLGSLPVRTVILTNGGSDAQTKKMERLRLADLVDAIVISEEVGQAKPSAGAFDAALRAVRGDAGMAVMVGDDLETDVRAALAAGFAFAVWLSSTAVNAEDPLIRKVSRLDQVVPALGLVHDDVHARS
jgi:HAD superfamily hydrolase (TIGR01549 family)